jgi:hypothetical protein
MDPSMSACLCRVLPRNEANRITWNHCCCNTLLQLWGPISFLEHFGAAVGSEAIVGTHRCNSGDRGIVGVYLCNRGSWSHYWLATMTSDHIIQWPWILLVHLFVSNKSDFGLQFRWAVAIIKATSLPMLWREEHVWHFSVLRRVHLSSLVITTVAWQGRISA